MRFHRFVRDDADKEHPPACPVRYFYTSLSRLDDPLAPVPPILASTSPTSGIITQPFSARDNAALDEAWLKLRQKSLQHEADSGKRLAVKHGSKELVHNDSWRGAETQGPFQKRADTTWGYSTSRTSESDHEVNALDGQQEAQASGVGVGMHTTSTSTQTFSRDGEPPDLGLMADSIAKSTTGTPFARVPSKKQVTALGDSGKEDKRGRSGIKRVDSYDWNSDQKSSTSIHPPDFQVGRQGIFNSGVREYVPVGISRLHHVVLPQLSMEPIYWSPINDVSTVVRGTWFYSESMLPVEVDVAIMLEAGYIALRPWTETWQDELNSAIEAGALGEMRVVHPLWPEPRTARGKPAKIRPGTYGSPRGSIGEPPNPEGSRRPIVEASAHLMNNLWRPGDPDNIAAGFGNYRRDGQVCVYQEAGIIYADEKQAYILRQSLRPSAYYGRRPLANYIRKGRSIGIPVTRGFEQTVWDRLQPAKKEPLAQTRQRVSTSESGGPPYQRQQSDSALAESQRPKVTDLVLVVHGIGQKLSERVESYHFTHVINAFRREFNAALGNDSIKPHQRESMGGIMVLPVNWRSKLKFEEGGYKDQEDPAMTKFSLEDITPGTLSSVRNIVNDVMFDVPYYLSHHQPRMIAAVIGEANRIYELWCRHNPGFSDHGRVHLIAHSLGSVMALDILSRQSTSVPEHLRDPQNAADGLSHFAFNTHSLFLCGSPVGFFLLLKRATLVPRRGIAKEGANDRTVTSEEGIYGCPAVTNIYNIINPYDPVAYCLNAAIGAAYASSLKQPFIPSATSSWFTGFNPFSSASKANVTTKVKATIARLPSNLQLETHNFTREELAEKRAYLLNDNGQVDFYLRYGGGPLDIQYFTMLGAHSSYWLSRDFVRFLVLEIGR